VTTGKPIVAIYVSAAVLLSTAIVWAVLRSRPLARKRPRIPQEVTAIKQYQADIERATDALKVGNISAARDALERAVRAGRSASILPQGRDPTTGEVLLYGIYQRDGVLREGSDFREYFLVTYPEFDTQHADFAVGALLRSSGGENSERR
jgi:hypothetical protein